ncbi:MAG: DCC1-like thiol-disulfide oxidoreductase family protein [Leptospira sp.]|nr:DCC1-like thiol-disulfide oxidoreductase family protein [Leptospira sp.]
MDQIFLYDGNCEFCKNLAKSLERKTDASISFISFRSLTEDQLSKIHPNLNVKVCESDVQFIEAGVRYPGFFAVRSILWKHQTIKYLNIFLYLPLVPVFGMAAMYVLKRFKSNS